MLDGGLCCDFSLLFETLNGLPGNGAVPEIKQNAREKIILRKQDMGLRDSPLI